MRFKKFLTESENRSSATRNVSEEKAYEFLDNNPIALENLEKQSFLWRGVDVAGSPNFMVGDSSTFRRKAANTFNYVNLYIGTMPSWQHLPSRESAFIGTTDETIADAYGALYAMIPADSAKLGMCPKDDFWGSFSKSPYLINELNDALHAAAAILDIKLSEADTPAECRAAIEKINADNILEIMTQDEKKPTKDRKVSTQITRASILAERIKKTNVLTAAEFLDIILEPVGFKAITPAARLPFGSNEVWVNGECLFIKANELKNLGFVK